MHQRLSFLLTVSVLAPVAVAAEAPAIEHQPVACVAAGKFPRLQARFVPAESVARARVQFQAEGTRHWYGVAMTRAGAEFSAVLPQPKKSLKSYRYYLDVTDTSLGARRTPEYRTTVAGNASACADKKVAGGLGSAAVTLEVPAGAPSVPGGFSANGVIAVGAAGAAVAAGAATGAAAAGGGVSTALLVGGGLAVAAAGAGVAVAARGGGEGGEDGTGRTTYTGSFSGQYVVTQISSGGNVTNRCLYTHSFTGTMTVIFEQSSPTGQAQIAPTDTVTGVTGGASCTGLGPGNFMGFFCTLTGAPGNLACGDESTSTNGSRTSTVTHAFAGALSGGVISGTITFAFTGQGGDARTTVTDSASTTYPVTLR